MSETKLHELNQKIKEKLFHHTKAILPSVIKEIQEVYPNFISLGVVGDAFSNTLIVCEVNQVEIDVIPIFKGSKESEECKSAYLEMNLTGREFRDIREVLLKVPYLSFHNSEDDPAVFLVTSEGWVEL